MMSWYPRIRTAINTALPRSLPRRPPTSPCSSARFSPAAPVVSPRSRVPSRPRSQALAYLDKYRQPPDACLPPIP